MVDLAVIGAGSMGSLHARVAMGLRDATLRYVVDPDPEVGGAVAAQVGVEHASHLEEILDRVDAAIVAVPTALHRSIGETLLAAGVHVLMEKPIAVSGDEAAVLQKLATDAGVTLMVGHVERFNPVVMELEHIIQEPLHIDIARIGRFAKRITDDVIIDLLVHDLDIACALMGDYEPSLQAVGQRVMTNGIDLVTATLEFASGATAVLTASRVGQHKIRRIEATQRDSFVAADLLKQTLLVQRATAGNQMQEGGYRQESTIEVPYLRHRGEPLYLEQTHFIECVTERRVPKVTGSDGARVLEMALQVRALVA